MLRFASSAIRDRLRGATLAAATVGMVSAAALTSTDAAPPSANETRGKQAAPATPNTPAAATTPAPSAPAQSTAAPARVEGFRSAKFGMSEDEVRAAIKTDFPADGIVEASTNPVEQTSILALKIPAPLPSGGAAKVSYVFGYKSKKLIQVSIVWSKATDDKNDAAQLVAAGEILKVNFVEQNYKPDSIGINQNTSAGVLLFKGDDAQDRTTILLLQGTTSGEKPNETFTPSSLLVMYTADAKRPDIYKLTQGQF